MVHPGPFLATNIVAFALAEFGSSDQREGDQYPRPWPPASPSPRGPSPSPTGTGPPRPTALTATPAGAGFVLDGVKSYVHDAQAADLLLVTATGAGRPHPVPGARGHPGRHRRAARVPRSGPADGRRALHLGRGAAPTPWSAPRVAPGRPSSASSRWPWSCSAPRPTGPPTRAWRITVQYAKDRVAFGRPIGSYQALKHRMADHRMWLEGSFATTAYAARAVRPPSHDAAMAARVAKAHVGKWSSAILHDCIQLHGGIGMTWEYDLHLYFRRAISNEVLYGIAGRAPPSLVDLAEGAA